MNGNFKKAVFYFDQINTVDEFSISGDGLSQKVKDAKFPATRYNDLSVDYGNFNGGFGYVFNGSGVDGGINDIPRKAGALSIVEDVYALGIA